MLEVIDNTGTRRVHRITPFEEMLESQYIHTCLMRDILAVEGGEIPTDVYVLVSDFYVCNSLLFARYVRERFATDFKEGTNQ